MLPQGRVCLMKPLKKIVSSLSAYRSCHPHLICTSKSHSSTLLLGKLSHGEVNSDIHGFVRIMDCELLKCLGPLPKTCFAFSIHQKPLGILPKTSFASSMTLKSLESCLEPAIHFAVH